MILEAMLAPFRTRGRTSGHQPATAPLCRGREVARRPGRRPKPSPRRLTWHARRSLGLIVVWAKRALSSWS